MNKQFSLHVPLNPVSYGCVSIALCRQIYSYGLSPCIFPIGQPDLSSQKRDADFEQWLSSCVNKTHKMHKRSYPVFRLWHLNQCLDSISNRRLTCIFNETDAITDTEKNIIEQQDVCYVTSKFTKEVIEETGVTNIKYLPLGFDSHNFFTKRRKIDDGRIIFTLNGKRELRKATDKIVRAWVKKFGNQREYQLNLSIFNPFFRRSDGPPLNWEEQKMLFIQQVLDNKHVWNINFIGWMATLSEVNDLYNCGHIDLGGLSLCEGFNIPTFTQLCLGKHAVVLNAHVHKDFANSENSVLVEPSAKVKAVDGLFFHENTPFLQGNWFDWEEDAAINAMEKAVERVRINPTNVKGQELKLAFNWEKTLNSILEDV